MEKLWLLFPLFFVGLSLLISSNLSRTGWRSFASRYPARSRPSGTSYASPLSWFGSSGPVYRNVVRVIFTEAGISFRAAFSFRAFHPPFLVPWASVRRIEKKDGGWRKRYQLDIQDAVGEIHVLLPAKAEHDLFRYYRAA
jgi:hypothetical protein